MIRFQAAPTRLEAKLFLGAASSSASSPQKFECGDDDVLYAVKFRNNTHGDGRALVGEHLAGRCGSLIGAPVAEVDLIEVGHDLVKDGLVRLNDGTSVVAGVHHGSKWVERFGDRKGIEYVDQNRTALGALEVLYSWLLCTGDHQLLYHDDRPHNVLSVDHSEMLPGSVGDWSLEVLSQQQDTVELDPFFGPAGLGASDRASALSALEAVSDEAIAEAVAGPPDEWGLDAADRIALAGYLAARRVRLLETLT